MAAAPKLLITGAWQNAKSYLTALEEMGYQVEFLQQEAEALPSPAADYDVVVCNNLFVHHPQQDFTQLKRVQATCTGLDRMPLAELEARGVAVVAAQGVYAASMAQQVLAGVLQLYRHSAWFAANQRNAIWEKRRDLQDLQGKRVLLVGTGALAKACAKLFRAFGCKLTALSRAPHALQEFDEVGELAQMEAHLPAADILVLACPLTPETTHLVDAAALAQLSSNAIVVNVARGALVDEVALVGALQQDQIAGAVLDVFEQEPLPQESPLWTMDNVVITPHVSYVGDQAQQQLDEWIMSGLRECLGSRAGD